MAIIVNVHEAKTHLSRLLKQALAGDEISAASAGLLDWDHRDPFDRMRAAQARQ